jgi:hypothetical protein
VAVIGSHFISKSPRRFEQAAADLGYTIYGFAVEVAESGIATCVTRFPREFIPLNSNAQSQWRSGRRTMRRAFSEEL